MRLKALQVLLIPKSLHQRERILRQIFRLARFNFDKAFFCHVSLVYRGIEGLGTILTDSLFDDVPNLSLVVL